MLQVLLKTSLFPKLLNSMSSNNVFILVGLALAVWILKTWWAKKFLKFKFQTVNQNIYNLICSGLQSIFLVYAMINCLVYVWFCNYVVYPRHLTNTTVSKMYLDIITFRFLNTLRQNVHGGTPVMLLKARFDNLKMQLKVLLRRGGAPKNNGI